MYLKVLNVQNIGLWLWGQGIKTPSSVLACDWNFWLTIAKKYPCSQEQGVLGTQKKDGGRVSVFLFFLLEVVFLAKIAVS